MSDIYQGDPRIFINADGSSFNFVGGQPTMDRGLENLAIISLFTEPEWVGNTLFSEIDQRAGSDFEIIARQPITSQTMNNLINAAEIALKNPAFGNVEVVVDNPSGYRLDITITLSPPGQDIKTLLLTKNGLNWISQAIDPANLRG